ncbi:DUF6182 family protein [Actinomadura sp. DC4]|uniref:DUF6182 family protein n=1 Tax=Actinomadura sp. DC4 TaxID=3055069 RepID=UPI0025AF7201|nr:DUF6182 family protein [Actinomadura sp. DC4]MDN3352434.1 DUF6182 family protein [Actinomadura sp. DC4]
MTIGPELLRDEAVRRLRAARPDLAHGRDLSTVSGLAAVQREVGAEVMAVSVVGRFDLLPWIRGTCAYAAGLPPSLVPAWRRSFTRTIFLAGNPGNLADRFSFAHVSEDGGAAWTVPDEESALMPLRRLLKLFDGPGSLPAQAPLTVGVPGSAVRAPVRRALYVAVAGITVAEVMVHLNHLLCEAVLDGLLACGDVLTVRPVPRLSGVTEPFAALRVGGEEGRADRLRAFAGLTKEIGHD